MTAAPRSTGRREYLDWLRGIGVIVMIQGHVMDAWTLTPDKTLVAYQWIHFIGGVGGAPLFLFLAGLALAMAAGSRFDKGRTVGEAAALARRRGWQIFGLAFLFRLQSWLISGGPPARLLKVDILNVMGIGLVAAGVVWALGRGVTTRVTLFAATAAGCAMVTPLVRASALVAGLPDPVEWYLVPAPNTTAFTLLPWVGFLFAGAACGTLLQAAREGAMERRVNLWLGVGGVIVAAGGYAAAYLPPIYAQTNFWTSSPTFFFVRLGLVMALVPLAYLLKGKSGRSALGDFGRASLFVYWIHVEIVYGVLTTVVHRALPLPWSYVAFILFTLVMFATVKLKNHFSGARVLRLNGTPTPKHQST